jgi:hypothetical protein
MSIRPLILLLVVFPAAPLLAQAPLPPDINPVTLSRLPPVTAADLDAEGQRLLAARGAVTPASGAGHITIYSPKLSEGPGPLGRYLGVPRGEEVPSAPLLSAGGPDYGQRDRSAVRVVGPRTRGPAGRAGTAGD